MICHIILRDSMSCVICNVFGMVCYVMCHVLWLYVMPCVIWYVEICHVSYGMLCVTWHVVWWYVMCQFQQGPTHGRASTTSCLEKMLYCEIYSDSERRASTLLAFSSQPIRNQPELLLAGLWLAERKMQEEYLLCIWSWSKFHRITFFLSMMGRKSLVTT